MALFINYFQYIHMMNRFSLDIFHTARGLRQTETDGYPFLPSCLPWLWSVLGFHCRKWQGVNFHFSSTFMPGCTLVESHLMFADKVAVSSKTSIQSVNCRFYRFLLGTYEAPSSPNQPK